MTNEKTTNISFPLRIEICGGIASGKTTFANLLKRMDANAILEDFSSNPFWKAFYSNPGKYIFETEISFVLQHYHQIKKDHVDGKINACDFSFFLDIAYAEIGLKGAKREAFLAVYNEIKKELPPPDLLVYLNCDAETELKRIRNRGRSVEDSIDTGFLSALNEAVKQQIDEASKKIKVIEIDSAEKNFADDESVKQEMTEIISKALKEVSHLN